MTKQSVKLPRSLKDGKRLTKHPLVELVDTLGSIAKVAKKIKWGVDRTTVSPYYVKALEDRDLLVPADWVLDLANLANLHPYYFRPDLYPKEGVPPV